MSISVTTGGPGSRCHSSRGRRTSTLMRTSPVPSGPITTQIIFELPATSWFPERPLLRALGVQLPIKLEHHECGVKYRSASVFPRQWVIRLLVAMFLALYEIRDR